MGEGRHESAGYALLYRSFDHAHMRTACDALGVPRLNERMRRALRGRDAVGQEVRTFAGAFVQLQQARHEADYDPTVTFEPSGVRAYLQMMADAIAAFERIPPDEKADILALLMVKAR